jgi:RES domain-containing protein
VGWRLDVAVYRDTWHSGEGAYLFGGRWNRKGTRVVYCSLDPATAILEVAVHKGFQVLDTVAHVLTSFRVQDLNLVHVVQPGDVPNPNWLRPGLPSAGQQKFGDDMLSKHPFVLIPSAVSAHSWNLLLAMPSARGAYTQLAQEAFALDTRLHPPPP